MSNEKRSKRHRPTLSESLHSALWVRDFTKNGTRHKPEQIIRKLETAEQLIAKVKIVVDA
jgi:hypothetical protein